MVANRGAFIFCGRRRGYAPSGRNQAHSRWGSESNIQHRTPKPEHRFTAATPQESDLDKPG
jgi:hypothetical protein